MTALPSELQNLVEGYRQILIEVDKGHIDLDTAYARLGELAVTDGQGARWNVSPDRDPDDAVFLRTDPAGGPAVPTSPASFAAPSTMPGAGEGSTAVDGSVGGGWTDQVDDLLSPPQTPNRFGVEDDGWGSAPSSDMWGGPDLNFPDDVHVGAPPDTRWDPLHSSPAASSVGHEEGPEQYGHDATPREGVVSRVFDLGGRALEGITSKFSALGGGQRRTVVIAVACVVVLAVFLFIRGGGDGSDETSAEGFTYSCPSPSLPISGAPADIVSLLGCLDSRTDSPGPAIAGVGVERVESGEVMYRPDRVVVRAEAVHTAIRLYNFAGGPAPQSSNPADIMSLPADQAASVQAAVDLGLITEVGDLSLDVSRGEQAVLLYRGLARAGVISDAPGGVAPQDTPEGAPEFGIAVASLRVAGIVDGEATDTFNFDDSVMVSDWVLWAGRAAHEIRDPGSMKLRIAAPQEAGDVDGRRPTPRGGDDSAAPVETAPSPERVQEVITAVISGDPSMAVAMLLDAGDTSTITERVAMWTGFAELGATVTAQAAPAVDGDTAVQVWQVGPADGDPVLTYNVAWVLQDGAWMLSGWPSR